MKNKQLKERFLSESKLLLSTQRTFGYLLDKAGISEDDFDKDIYEFTPYEADQMLYTFGARSEAMMFVILTCLKEYIDFCKTNNLTSDDFNYFASIRGIGAVRKYVDTVAIENQYITYEELLEIEKLCINAQDAVIVELLFLGVKGESSSELLNLKYEQVSDKNIHMGDRVIPISPRSYDLIKQAYEQDVYEKKNGEFLGLRGGQLELPQDVEYVLKPSRGGNDQLSHQALQARMLRIKEYFGNPYLTLSKIWVSGMIHMAKEIKEEKGKLEKEDWIAINKRFGYPESYWSQTKLRIKHLV